MCNCVYDGHTHTQNTGIKGPFLVIAPLSTIANWQREAELWTDFNIIVYHGSAYSRRLIHEYELYHRDDSGKIIPNTYKFDIIITTYEVILCKFSATKGSILVCTINNSILYTQTLLLSLLYI